MRYWIYAALAATALWTAYSLGKSTENDRWQSLWSQRDSDSAAAVARKEGEERAKEAHWQALIEQARSEGNERIKATELRIAAVSAESVGLRKSIDGYAARYIESQKRIAALAPTGGAPTGAACGVLPRLLDESVAMAQVYAATSDRARARGLTCERAYDAVAGPR